MQVLWQCPKEAIAALVLAHGAGAGMTHRHMQALADAFAGRGVATLRFNFAYMEEGKGRVDPPPIATGRIAAAFAATRERTELPIWLGGHSFGGRMASHALLDQHLPAAGLIFCSFPLHNPGQPAVKRAEHLSGIQRPMLFLSGTRDKLAERRVLEPLVAGLRNAELHWLDTADHGYGILKRSRESTEDVFDEIARVARAFIERHP
jgi:predicted alpha/beta-hydrolase family hydrolase